MTTSFSQSINLLQMSAVDVSHLIQEELERNPLLSVESADSDQREITVDNEGLDETPDDRMEYQDENLSMNNMYSSAASTDITSLSYDISEEVTLRQHVIEQIYLNIENQHDKVIAFHLVEYLNDTGYIEFNVKELKETLNCSEERILSVLEKLQKFDPAGVFARNLSECLKLQLEDKNLLDTSYKQLLDNLELLAKLELNKLKKLCQCNDLELKEMIKVIKSLNPKPGNNFLSEQIHIRTPDVFVSKVGHGDYKVELNYKKLPKLLIDKEYYSKVKKNNCNKEEKKYLSAQYSAASTLIRALEQRVNTILTVATAIVEHQLDFFEKGVMGLTPMTISDIATATGFNESTISRVTTQKYMFTSYGIMEMKDFFTSGVTNEDGEAISSAKIKEIMKNLIELENENNVFSDEDIAIEISKFNIKVARRTVAKYRNMLKIPSSAMRKRTLQAKKKI